MSTLFLGALLRPFLAVLLIFCIARPINTAFRRYAPEGRIKRLLLREIPGRPRY